MVRKTGIELFLEVTICVEGNKSVEEGHMVTMKVNRELFKDIPNVKDVIVHVEPL